jgi:hypothetical protein
VTTARVTTKAARVATVTGATRMMATMVTMAVTVVGTVQHSVKKERYFSIWVNQNQKRIANGHVGI